jgi:hypothetical protein
MSASRLRMLLRNGRASISRSSSTTTRRTSPRPRLATWIISAKRSQTLP